MTEKIEPTEPSIFLQLGLQLLDEAEQDGSQTKKAQFFLTLAASGVHIDAISGVHSDAISGVRIDAISGQLSVLLVTAASRGNPSSTSPSPPQLRRPLLKKNLYRNVQRFRGGLVFKDHRLCVSLNSRLASNKEEEDAQAHAAGSCPTKRFCKRL